MLTHTPVLLSNIHSVLNAGLHDSAGVTVAIADRVSMAIDSGATKRVHPS